MWKIFIIIFGVLFGIFMPRSIYENYTDADLEDSTYEEYSYANSEDSAYEDYDPTKTDWENYGDTGSIMEIADTDWALENAPVFHVETKEQLAGVVYYVNAVKGYNDSVELYLEADIDLDGLEWVPMGGWYRPDRYLEHTTFVGLIDGQNHIIKNMHIDTKYGGHCGFVGYSYSLQMKNITFEKAYVSGGTYVGIAGGEIYGSEDWINVNVSGMVGTPGPETGSIVGREAGINFRDCAPSLQASPCTISPVHSSAVYRWMNSVMLPQIKVSRPRARKRFSVRPVSSFTSRSRQSSGLSNRSNFPPTPIHLSWL